MTDLRPVPDAPATFEVDLDASWTVMGKPYGGYLLRLLAQAAARSGPEGGPDHPHPFAVSAHFLTSPDLGPATLTATRLRTGRRVATTRVDLSQGGALRAAGLLTTTATLPTADGAGPLLAAAVPPVLPDLADCPRSPVEPVPGVVVGHLAHVDLRLDPATTGHLTGAPSGTGAVAGWVRMAEGDQVSPLDLLVIADALPPVTFTLGVFGWAPTSELTVHVRAVPAPGWLRVVQRAHWVEDGWLDEECLVWDSTGRLVCEAHQLASYRA